MKERVVFSFGSFLFLISPVLSCHVSPREESKTES